MASASQCRVRIPSLRLHKASGQKIRDGKSGTGAVFPGYRKSLPSPIYPDSIPSAVAGQTATNNFDQCWSADGKTLVYVAHFNVDEAEPSDSADSR